MTTSQDEFDALEITATFTIKEWATISAVLLQSSSPEAFPLFMGIDRQVLEGLAKRA